MTRSSDTEAELTRRGIALTDVGPVRAVAVDTVMGAEDSVLLVDATAAEIDITLPPVQTSRGSYAVKKVDAAANDVVVTPDDGDIDGAGSVALTAQYDVIVLVSDGDDWHVLTSVVT